MACALVTNLLDALDRLAGGVHPGFRPVHAKGAHLAVVKDGPHCITWTHADKVTPALVEFLN
jgi:hypothetical protein